jgi:hypothetical protein
MQAREAIKDSGSFQPRLFMNGPARLFSAISQTVVDLVILRVG